MHIEDFDINKHCDAMVVATQRITPDDAVDEVKEIILEVNNPDFNYRDAHDIHGRCHGGPEPARPLTARSDN